MDPEVLAVVLALAGVRGGDRVAQVGAGERVERGLLAMSGPAAGRPGEPARVCVAGGSRDVRTAAALVGAGGRVVALAGDAASARQDAQAVGIAAPHLVGLPDGRVAWSGRLPR